MSACTLLGSWTRISADTVEGETPSNSGWRNATKERPSVCGQGKELRSCFERTRAAFPPIGVYGPISNSGRHSDINDTVVIITSRYVPNTAAKTPITARLYSLLASREMEVVPGDQPDEAGRKLSIDTLDSAHSLGENPRKE